MRILKGFESKEEATERTYREQEKIRLVNCMYITIDNVPSGVILYKKPGSR